MEPFRRDGCYGFTLLELLVVLAILGLVAGVVVVRLQEPYRAAQLGDAVSRVTTLDRQARSHTQRFARNAILVYDLDKNTAYVESGGAKHQQSFWLDLPGSVQLDRIRTVDRQTDQGQFTIDLSTAGQGRSYAIRLSTADGHYRWLFFAGLTGQVVEMKAQEDVKNLFEIVRPAGDDAG